MLTKLQTKILGHAERFQRKGDWYNWPHPIQVTLPSTSGKQKEADVGTAPKMCANLYGSTKQTSRRTCLDSHDIFTAYFYYPVDRGTMLTVKYRQYRISIYHVT